MMTRMVKMLSQVVLYNANLTNLNNVTGDQVKNHIAISYYDKDHDNKRFNVHFRTKSYS